MEATESANALSFYIGDDITDEDAFSALPEGFTIRVGHAKGTAARYYLDQQRLVTHFLAWLADARARGAAASPVQRVPVANMRRA